MFYLDKYRGSNSDWQYSNVVESLWVKHIGTFTMLNRKLSFSAKAFIAIYFVNLRDNINFDNFFSLNMKRYQTLNQRSGVWIPPQSFMTSDTMPQTS